MRKEDLLMIFNPLIKGSLTVKSSSDSDELKYSSKFFTVIVDCGTYKTKYVVDNVIPTSREELIRRAVEIVLHNVKDVNEIKSIRFEEC